MSTGRRKNSGQRDGNRNVIVEKEVEATSHGKSFKKLGCLLRKRADSVWGAGMSSGR